MPSHQLHDQDHFCHTATLWIEDVGGFDGNCHLIVKTRTALTVYGCVSEFHLPLDTHVLLYATLAFNPPGVYRPIYIVQPTPDEHGDGYWYKVTPRAISKNYRLTW